MNWAAKDYSEIALNQIWSEHVRRRPANTRASPTRSRMAGAWGGDRGGGVGGVGGGSGGDRGRGRKGEGSWLSSLGRREGLG